MATNSKMFVHYSGTKSAFIAAGLPSQYTNKIVFISGDAEGNGAAVYTHGKYYGNVAEAIAALKFFGKISANGVTAEAAGNDGIITFSADDPASVAIKVDEKGVHFGLTDEFKTAVNSTLPNRIKAIEDDYLKTADKTEITEAASALEGRVAANEGAIATLNGEGEGSVKKQVADAIAGVVAGAPEDFDTLKEVAEWIGSDTTGAAQMQADIATLKGGDTVEGSVAKTVKDAVAAEAEIARAAEKQNADDIDAAEGRIKAIEDDYLKAADKTELQGNIDGVSAVANAAAPQATTYTKTEVDGLISTSEGKLADYYKKTETYSQAEVDAMWAWEEL